MQSNGSRPIQHFRLRQKDGQEQTETISELRRKLLAGEIGENAEVALEGGEWKPISELYDRLFPSWR